MLKQANHGLRSCDPNWGAENADLHTEESISDLIIDVKNTFVADCINKFRMFWPHR